MPIDQSDSFYDAHLAAIVENSSDAIVSKNLDGIVQSWNAAAEKLFGWTADEIIGRSIRLIVPDDRQREEDEILAKIKAGEPVPRFETIRQAKGGGMVSVGVTVSPIKDDDGNIIGASKIATDLRESRGLRRALDESRQQFVALADNIPQLAWMADGSGYIFWYNARWFEYTGTTLDQMEGWGWQKVHHPEHVDRVTQRIQLAWDTGEPWEDTFPLRRADGIYRWFLSRARPIRDEKGDVVLWCGTNTDITEQRETTERINLLMNEVNHRSRNMLATVQSIMHRTIGDGAPELTNALSRRIRALAANQDLLNDSDWVGASINDIVRTQIMHVTDVDDQRVKVEGETGVMLDPAPAEALGLAIHELATNANKYGALSGANGKVTVTWDTRMEGDRQMLEIEWSEEGGPEVQPPVRTGFGTVILTRNPEIVLKGKVELDYLSTGVVWRFTGPLKA